jgi:CheY-like chemotaxis protein
MGNPIRVLWVDDQPTVREVTEIFLSRAGYDVESAANGEAAWEKIGRDIDAFDLVITDCQMPLLNGVELVKRLRERNFAGRIIVFSSGLDSDLTNEFRALQVDAIVPKGSPAAELLSTVQRVTTG